MSKLGLKELILGSSLLLAPESADAKDTKRSQEDETRRECDIYRYQVRSAIIKALYGDRSTRGGVEVFADASAELTINKCLKDHGLKAKK